MTRLMGCFLIVWVLVWPSAARGQQQDSDAGRRRSGQEGGSQGGAAQADFDSLIDLIQSTVSADSWMENGTGAGEIAPFPNGVFADAAGTLRFAEAFASVSASVPANGALGRIPKQAPSGNVEEVRQSSSLRYVSLPRLEGAIRERQQRHQPLAVEMLTLAGLRRVEYVFVLPASGDSPGDLVLAGPAGDWRVRPDGKIVGVETGQPVVRLDDLLTVWRRHQQQRGGAFGVSINPRQAGLARIQKYVSRAEPLEPGERGDWLEGLQESLGRQDVEFFGIASDSHVAQVLLLADYHMKLIGMGLAEGVEGVASYLDTVKLGEDGRLPSMSVLRWWFAMEYEPVATTVERDVFRLRGPGAKVLSENELLAARGKRVHTGQSETLNRRFASSFSERFEKIAQKYPLYAELRNVFDLSMVVTLVEREGLLERAGWQPVLFAHADWLALPRVKVPTEVETVVNHRVIRRKHIVAGVSGGVWVDGRKTLKVERGGSELANAKLAPQGESVWWWD